MTPITNINIGTTPNDGTGTPLRTAGDIINTNFNNLNTYKQEILAEGPFVDGDKTKLDGIQDNATENQTDSFLLDRTNHTGDEDLTNVNLTIPNGTTPVINSNGQIAIDTSVAGLSHGILRYYSGEELFNLPLPVSNLSSLNNGYIPKFNATTQEFELSPENTGPGDTINNNINTIKKDSTAGTSDTYGVLTGAVDGVNTTFTVSNSKYVSGTLTVYRNGARQIQGVSEDWVETNPVTGTFDFNTPPLSGDAIDVEYSNLEATADSIIVEKDVTTVSTNYTALISDRVILVNASAGDVTITLPEISELDSIGISIKKIDISGNIVNIVTPNSETIDNETSIDILAPYQSRSILSDGINYFVI